MTKVPIELIIEDLRKPPAETTVPLYVELEEPRSPIATVEKTSTERGVIFDILSETKISFEIDI